MFNPSLIHPTTHRSLRSAPDETAIFDWIEGWEPVREDFLMLLDAYAHADTGHDISSILPLVEQLDSAMRLLRHRVERLHENLGLEVGR